MWGISQTMKRAGFSRRESFTLLNNTGRNGNVCATMNIKVIYHFSEVNFNIMMGRKGQNDVN